jgi:hypothetical protein
MAERNLNELVVEKRKKRTTKTLNLFCVKGTAVDTVNI